MIRINLLPVRQARKVEAARRDILLGAIGGAIVLVLCMVAWGAAQAHQASVLADVRKVEAEIAAAKADKDAVDEMEKKMGELDKKLAVIEELRTRKIGPVHMLDELAMATPERVTVTTLTEKGGLIELVGVSVSNEVISQFLRALDASPYFEQVFLKDIEASKEVKDRASRSQIPLKKFKLSARFVNPYLAKETDKKAAGDKAVGDKAAGDKAAGDKAPAPAAPAAGGHG